MWYTGKQWTKLSLTWRTGISHSCRDKHSRPIAIWTGTCFKRVATAWNEHSKKNAQLWPLTVSHAGRERNRCTFNWTIPSFRSQLTRDGSDASANLGRHHPNRWGGWVAFFLRPSGMDANCSPRLAILLFILIFLDIYFFSSPSHIPMRLKWWSWFVSWA